MKPLKRLTQEENEREREREREMFKSNWKDTKWNEMSWSRFGNVFRWLKIFTHLNIKKRESCFFFFFPSLLFFFCFYLVFFFPLILIFHFFLVYFFHLFGLVFPSLSFISILFSLVLFFKFSFFFKRKKERKNDRKNKYIFFNHFVLFLLFSLFISPRLSTLPFFLSFFLCVCLFSFFGLMAY